MILLIADCSKEVLIVEDWIANAYEGMSRRQFLARMGAGRVCDLPRSPARLLRGLPAQLPGRRGQGCLGSLRGVVQ
jgi:hypothetical protein